MAQKTGEVIVSQLGPDSLAAIGQFADKGPRLFSVSYRGAQQAFSGLVATAGLKGSIKRLRATGATWCQVDKPGSASAYLGHRTPWLAEKHYVDPRFLRQHKPRPPRIDV